MRTLSLAATVGTAFLLLALCGCGRSPSTETVVKGHALYRGEPVAGGTIVFAPDPDRGSSGPIARGVIQPDGSYQVTTPDGKPIAAGWYRVAVAPRPGSVDPQTAERPYPGLPQKYRNPALSGLVREIRSGQENLFYFDLDDR